MSTDAPKASGETASTGPAPAAAATPQTRKSTRRRKLLIGGIGVLVAVVLVVFGIPWIRTILSTVSTDDAFVNGYVTFVAARVGGQVARVLVEDNNRVRKGDLLVELDKEPFEVAVAVSRAAVAAAEADLGAAKATVRGIEAEARAKRWKLQRAVEDVENQVSLLRARIAAVDKSKAALTLAQLDFDRARQLVGSDNIPRAEFDRRQAALVTARAGLTQSLADVYQTRAALGLAAEPAGGDLAQVPADLDQNFSAVREAQADLIQSAAQLGVIRSFGQTPQQMIDAFEKSDPQGDIDRILARLAADAPAVKQAEARLEVARHNLAQAELNLRYCDVVAEIDGVVTRRNVNPGNNVQAGEGLMALRSLRDIWVDANFKETQLRDLRIGQPVDLYVDMYGGRPFKGRVAGFTMGTGSTLALLPAQNATGNFVKVVQRLPVRIELEGYDADKQPLFIGTSVVPYVRINEPPTGPDAGKFLQGSSPAASGPSGAAQ